MSSGKIAKALAALIAESHQAGVIHGDIHSKNFIRIGNTNTWKIVDLAYGFDSSLVETVGKEQAMLKLFEQHKHRVPMTASSWCPELIQWLFFNRSVHPSTALALPWYYLSTTLP